MRFGEKLKQEIKNLGLSSEDLAKECHVSRSYITLIENGKRLPGKKVIPRLAEVLHYKVNIVINWYLEEMRARLVK